jgi:hypothetical protein
MICQWFDLKTTGTACQWFDVKTTGMVFSGLISKPVVTVLPVLPQNRWLEFSSLGIKTSSYGLMIWVSKSPRQFLGLSLKIKCTMVCQLHLKTDGMIRRRGTRVEI